MERSHGRVPRAGHEGPGFRGKHALNFPIPADVDHKVADRYGAWREKVRFGKRAMGIQRSTFLIDAEGIVRKVWKNVQVDGHDEQVLAALRSL
jgi:peroxiredoxin Q/BCP